MFNLHCKRINPKKLGFLLYEINLSIVILTLVSLIILGSYANLIKSLGVQKSKLQSLQYATDICEYMKIYRKIPEQDQILGKNTKKYMFKVYISKDKDLDISYIKVSVFLKSDKESIVDLEAAI